MKKLFLIILFGLLACKADNPNVVNKFPQDPELKRLNRNGKMFSDEKGIILFQNKENKTESKKETKEQENLWKKSFKTISKILPISTADEESGLIVTDWGNAKNDSNLYKINIIITGNTFDKNNITLTVFKKSNNQKTVEDKEFEENILNKIFNTNK